MAPTLYLLVSHTPSGTQSSLYRLDHTESNYRSFSSAGLKNTTFIITNKGVSSSSTHSIRYTLPPSSEF